MTNCTLYFLHRRCESVNAVNCELLTFTLRVGPYRLGPQFHPLDKLAYSLLGSTFYLPDRTFEGTETDLRACLLAPSRSDIESE